MSGRVSDLHIQIMEDRAARGEEPNPFDDPEFREGYDEYKLREAVKNLRDDRKENGTRS